MTDKEFADAQTQLEILREREEDWEDNGGRGASPYQSAIKQLEQRLQEPIQLTLF